MVTRRVSRVSNLRVPELFQNVLGKEFGDFAMSGYRLRAASSRVAVPVVIPAMPYQGATGVL
jgi:hypothetical protein